MNSAVGLVLGLRWRLTRLRWTLCLLLCGVIQAQDLQPVPPLTSHVMDRTGTLSTEQTAALENQLANLEKSKGSQVVVLVVASTQPEDITSYANRLGNVWKIGRKGVGDGLILLVAKSDHKVRIEVTKTLEGAVPDLLASKIIAQAITPRFKQGDFGGGIQAGVERIVAAISGESLPDAATSDADSFSEDVQVYGWLIGAFMFFLTPLIQTFAVMFTSARRSALVLASMEGVLTYLLLHLWWLAVLVALAGFVFALFTGSRTTTAGLGSSRSSGWSSSGGSFGSSSGGGGGFSSGGGGDFGGGGASGDW